MVQRRYFGTKYQMVEQKVLDPLFERELDRLYEKKDISAMRELLLKPTDRTLCDGRSTPKIIAYCSNGDTRNLALTLAHPDMTSECLLSELPFEADGFENGGYIDAPIFECVVNGHVDCLELILNSQYVTSDALGDHSLSLYPLNTDISTSNVTQCMKLIIRHRLFDTSILCSERCRDKCTFAEYIKSDFRELIETIFDVYSDKELEKIFFDKEVILTLLTVRWNDTCVLIRAKIYEMRILDELITNLLSNPSVIKNNGLLKIMAGQYLFPVSWDEACKYRCRVSKVLSVILHSDDSTILCEGMKETVRGHIDTVFTVCMARCSLSMLSALIEICSPETLVNHRDTSGYNIFQLYCMVCHIEKIKTVKAKMRILLDIGINPNDRTPLGLSCIDIPGYGCSAVVNYLKTLCIEHSGTFTKRAV